jgi:Uma2 family endonuclease
MSENKKPILLPGMIKESPVTYEVYANLPDDGNRYEVSDGVLELMSPAPTPVHQLFSNELQVRLNQDCRNEYLIISAPVDVIFSNTEIRQPDLLMLRRDRISIMDKRGIHGAPDLIVEILSEYSRRRDKVSKRKVYAKYGVPEYWIADLSNYTLEQYVLIEGAYDLIEVYAGDERIRSDKITCLSFSMDDLVRDLPVLPG